MTSAHEDSFDLNELESDLTLAAISRNNNEYSYSSRCEMMGDRLNQLLRRIVTSRFTSIMSP